MMKLYRFFGQSKPDAGSLGPVRVVHVIEPVEDVGEMFKRDADAGIADGDRYAIRTQRHRYASSSGVNFSAFEMRLFRVFSTMSSSK